MRLRLALITVALVLLVPAAASASLADEQTQGQNLIAQLHAGTKTCSALSAGDLAVNALAATPRNFLIGGGRPSERRTSSA